MRLRNLLMLGSVLGGLAAPALAAAPAHAADTCVDQRNGATLAAQVELGPGDNLYFVNSNPAKYVVSAQQGNDVVKYDSVYNAIICLGDGADGADAQTYPANGSISVMGGPGNDHIIGTSFNDGLNGGDGNDFVVGSLGNDLVKGGPGDDSLYGGTGDDLIVGDDGLDSGDAGSGYDTCVGTENVINCEVIY